MTRCAYCEAMEERAERLIVRVEKAEKERAAYKRAKEENDDRYLAERDQARAERDELRCKLEKERDFSHAAWETANRERDALKAELAKAQTAMNIKTKEAEDAARIATAATNAAGRFKAELAECREALATRKDGE